MREGEIGQDTGLIYTLLGKESRAMPLNIIGG